MIAKAYSVSIIVPIYKVQEFIEKCVRSLFEQNFDQIEYIFINDCTPDKSIEVLEQVIKDYPWRKEDIKIFHNKKNKGASLTRRVGLDIARGDYILFIDADDWLELNAVSLLYELAKKDDADIVFYDFYLAFKNRIVPKKVMCLQEKFKGSLFSNALADCIIAPLVLKFARRKLYEKIIFPEYSYAEDRYISLQMVYFANKVSYLRKELYFYNRENQHSTTTSEERKRQNIEDLFNYYMQMEIFLKENDENESMLYLNRQTVQKLLLDSIEDDFVGVMETRAPELLDIKLLWGNSSVTVLKKLVFSLKFIRLDCVVNFIKKKYIQIRYKKN